MPGEYTVAGSQALYERDNHLEKIRIPGPILEPVVVYVSITVPFISVQALYELNSLSAKLQHKLINYTDYNEMNVV